MIALADTSLVNANVKTRYSMRQQALAFVKPKTVWRTSFGTLTPASASAFTIKSVSRLEIKFMSGTAIAARANVSQKRVSQIILGTLKLVNANAFQETTVHRLTLLYRTSMRKPASADACLKRAHQGKSSSGTFAIAIVFTENVMTISTISTLTPVRASALQLCALPDSTSTLMNVRVFAKTLHSTVSLVKKDFTSARTSAAVDVILTRSAKLASGWTSFHARANAQSQKKDALMVRSGTMCFALASASLSSVQITSTGTTLTVNVNALQ